MSCLLFQAKKTISTRIEACSSVLIATLLFVAMPSHAETPEALIIVDKTLKSCHESPSGTLSSNDCIALRSI
ncbi:MAG: hypothetical protein HQM14_14870 [SAR324 cluster bacterium]|nr:hypothetical protein [SAR324 cluster bacterium]